MKYSWIPDFILVSISFFLAYWIRQLFSPQIQNISFYYPLLAFSSVLLPLLFHSYHLYNGRRAIFSLLYLMNFLKALLLWGALLIIFSFFTKTEYSRFVIVLLFFLAGFFAYFIRLTTLWLSKKESWRPGDSEITDSVADFIKVSKVSPEGLTLLSNIQQRNDPGIIYQIQKRLFDIIGSFLGIAVLLILYPLISFFIKRDTAGKAVFYHERAGKDGKKFNLYKFRTMTANTAVYAKAPRKHDDSRITETGKILRKYSLDELPQLWNVLKGDMSLVGPRPEMLFIVDQYEPWQRIRLQAKPGITGIWQILGRKDLPLEENIEYDIYYIFHQSFFLDLAIILKTLPHLLFPRGSY